MVKRQQLEDQLAGKQGHPVWMRDSSCITNTSLQLVEEFDLCLQWKVFYVSTSSVKLLSVIITNIINTLTFGYKHKAQQIFQKQQIRLTRKHTWKTSLMQNILIDKLKENSNSHTQDRSKSGSELGPFQKNSECMLNMVQHGIIIAFKTAWAHTMNKSAKRIGLN